MTAAEILSELEARQVELAVVGDRLRFRPATAVPDELLIELREHKAELIELVSLRGWPDDSRDCVQRFGRPEARLYPFLGKHVATSVGGGVLHQVFAERVAVALFSDLRRLVYLLPSEVRPPELAEPVEGLFEAIH